jgi:Uma2 family endonuclease
MKGTGRGHDALVGFANPDGRPALNPRRRPALVGSWRLTGGSFDMSPIKTVPQPASASAYARAVPLEERHVMRGATWAFYDWLTDSLSARAPFRLAYDGKDIEIMTLGPKHEGIRELFSLFINEVSDGLEIDCRGLGSTTWKRAEVERGIEADLCYCFDPAKLEACELADNLDSNDVADFPNPDLTVEVDLSPSKIDRPEIYRALQISEVWRFRAGAVSIEQLGADGKYVAAESSRFLYVRADEITRWVTMENSAKRIPWKKRLRAWIQAELRPRMRPPGGPG